MKKILCLLTILLLLPPTMAMFGQQWAGRTIDNPFWLNLGLGVGGIGGSGALSVCLDLTFLKGEHTLSFRAAGCGGIDSEGMGDIGILYGWARPGYRSFFSWGAGLAYVHGNEFAGDIRTIGVPLEVQWFLRPTSFLGLGIYGFGNINFKKIFYGACLCLQIGVLR